MGSLHTNPPPYDFVRRDPCADGAPRAAVCGSGALPYDFYMCMGFLPASFAPETVEERLDLKSLKE
jgi:hypothetical protein